MKKKLFLSFLITSIVLLLLLPVGAFAQKIEPTPAPTPVQIFVDYTVVERDYGNDDAVNLPDTGYNRTFMFEIELGKLSRSKQLLVELKKVGIPVKLIQPHGIVVAYPEAMDDCKILADARRASEIALEHFPKNRVLRFNMGIMKNAFYQTLPPQCGIQSGAARPPIAALPF